MGKWSSGVSAREMSLADIMFRLTFANEYKTNIRLQLWYVIISVGEHGKVLQNKCNLLQLQPKKS